MSNHIDKNALRENERKAWWNATGKDVHPNLDDKKRDCLLAIYSALYSELRDKDGRQQQAMTWGFTVLAGSGIIGAVTGQWQPTQLASVMVIVILALFVLALLTLVVGYSRDRMSIARQLDRVHEVMRVFEKGEYYKESSLFDPNWRGWGFESWRDVNWRLTIGYCTLLVLALCADAVIILSASSTK